MRSELVVCQGQAVLAELDRKRKQKQISKGSCDSTYSHESLNFPVFFEVDPNYGMKNTLIACPITWKKCPKFHNFHHYHNYYNNEGKLWNFGHL